VIKALSSEVGTRSREENATNQKPGVFHRFRKMVKDFSTRSAGFTFLPASVSFRSRLDGLAPI
jgi:hypothetical protein